MSDKWTQQLHDKLAEHQTPAPDGLWDDIEAALASSGQRFQALQPGHSRFVALRRWAAAAAVATLIGGGALVWWTQESQERESMVSMVEHTAAGPLPSEAEDPREAGSLPSGGEDTREAGSLPSGGEDGGRGPHSNTNIAQATTHTEKPQTPPLAPPLEGRGAAAHEEPQATETQATETQAAPPQATEPQATETQATETQAAPPQPVSPAKASLPYQDHARPLPKQRKDRYSPTLSLYAMNGLGTKDNSNGVMMADAQAEKYANTTANAYAARQQTPIFLTGYEEREHHRQPVSFGLSASFPLGRRLSLTSGIVYTKMRSDFEQIIHSQQINKEQTLHYVGIPLGLSYRLWQTGAQKATQAKKQGAFSVYVGAGIQADWNVSAKMTTEGVESTMNRDRMQWSANASMGMQYNLLPRLALYAEPGLNYYFDNGSNIQNFFKDKPASMRLHMGMRLDW